MQKSNSNPKDILDQMTKNLNKEQMESFICMKTSWNYKNVLDKVEKYI